MYCIRTVWSDDTVTLSEPMSEWHANLVVFLYGDEDMWRGQTRPIRATLIAVSTPVQLVFTWRE